MGVTDRLFSKSPFALLIGVMQETNQVFNQIPLLFQALKSFENDTLSRLATEISEQEGKIDQLKKDIRQTVSQSMFLPFPKRDFLDLLFTMDSISDRIESLSKYFLLRELSYPPQLEEKIEIVILQLKAINQEISHIFIVELPGLLGASFRGPQADSVTKMIDSIAEQAYYMENYIHQAMVELFKLDDQLHPSEILLWTKIINKLEAVGHAIEKTGYTLRLLLEK